MLLHFQLIHILEATLVAKTAGATKTPSPPTQCHSGLHVRAATGWARGWAKTASL